MDRDWNREQNCFELRRILSCGGGGDGGVNNCPHPEWTQSIKTGELEQSTLWIE